MRSLYYEELSVITWDWRHVKDIDRRIALAMNAYG
jgi:hypothetical protein